MSLAFLVTLAGALQQPPLSGPASRRAVLTSAAAALASPALPAAAKRLHEWEYSTLLSEIKDGHVVGVKLNEFGTRALAVDLSGQKHITATTSAKLLVEAMQEAHVPFDVVPQKKKTLLQASISGMIYFLMAIWVVDVLGLLPWDSTGITDGADEKARKRLEEKQKSKAKAAEKKPDEPTPAAFSPLGEWYKWVEAMREQVVGAVSKQEGSDGEATQQEGAADAGEGTPFEPYERLRKQLLVKVTPLSKQRDEADGRLVQLDVDEGTGQVEMTPMELEGEATPEAQRGITTTADDSDPDEPYDI